ncbi:DUF1657 domain-containing protein [Phosphitispora sp. TUW77]|uniref:DUF1657 domain-containing protein n=1 Tax=Phosphitispora sp. TUW77 TaxID=3152361 RepID=UPI003AB1D20F
MTVASKVKQTIAALKGIKSTLEIYAVQSQDEKAVSVYQEGVRVAGEVADDLGKRLKTLEFEEPEYGGL